MSNRTGAREGRPPLPASTIDPATRALAAKASLPTDTGLIPGKSVMPPLAAMDAAGRGACQRAE
jgi:cobalt-zinc-cadmium efflux system membrane fusion protein